jgi:hypothetical protein
MMRVIQARNVHAALPQALELLQNCGLRGESRNGPVFLAPYPVTTVYLKPVERVMFWPQRDCNPFFHLYESLWMLSGRNDVAPLVRYASNMAKYSDNASTLRGAYGHRWFRYMIYDGDDRSNELNQIDAVVRRLRANPEDRRCVVSIWNSELDLDCESKDIPCNLTITFQVNTFGQLDMVVFCRSNDIIWGAYGANAVHMSVLHEYVARRVGVEIGTYSQVSVNWHAYVEPFQKLVKQFDLTDDAIFGDDPYSFVKAVPMPESADLDITINRIMFAADNELSANGRPLSNDQGQWSRVVRNVLRAHQEYRNYAAPEKFTRALKVLSLEPDDIVVDWIVAAREWVERRQTTWELKMSGDATGQS